MKIVPDTNVLIASLISQGVCYELIEHCFLNHALITSDFILDELREKLIGKFRFSSSSANEAVELFRSRMTVVEPTPLGQGICRDPDDDQILATALAGNCDCIISGDQDLLMIGSFRNIKILRPAQFSEHEA